MNQDVIVIGASGHGKVVADTVLSSGDHLIGFLDDNKEGMFIGYPVLGKVKEHSIREKVKYIIAIGDSIIRKKIAHHFDEKNVNWYTAIHPKAVVSTIDSVIGCGTVVLAEAVINSGAKIGKHCIVNSGAIVEHDNTTGDYVHISVGAKIGGTVEIGNNTWIGIGATVSNNVSICENCMIGAGSVVIRDILQEGTYVGIPAKRIK